MSSLTRRMQTNAANLRPGIGNKLGVKNPEAKDLLARLKREARNRGEA